MRDYAKIYTVIWRSRKFSRLDSDDARYLYLYLHSCPHSNLIGCFPLPEGYALADLGWDSERYRKAMDSLSKAFLVGFDRDEMLVRIVDFIRHDPFTNPKHAAGAVKVAMSLPDCEEKQRLIEDLRGAKYVNIADLGPQNDSLSKAYRNPEPEPEPEPIPEPKKEIAADAGACAANLQPDMTFRERILLACGVDPVSGMTGRGGGRIGRSDEMAELSARMAVRGIDEAQVLQIIAEVMAVRNSGPKAGPPSSLRFFLPALDEFAASRDFPPPKLQPSSSARASPPRKLWNLNPDDFNPDGSLRQ